jgi:hypothetical protein
MLKYTIKRYAASSSAKHPLWQFIKIFLTIFKDTEINKPLYCFTLPGFILGASGLYMGLKIIQNLQLEGSFNIEHAVLIALLTLTGTLMAFI